MSVDDYFDGRAKSDRAVYDAVVKHLETIGDVVVDVVSVGVLIKRERTFAELRPRRGGLSLGFLLSRVEEDERIAKTIKLSANRTAHFVDVAVARDIDKQVKGWLTEAYAVSPVSADRGARRGGRRP